MKFIISLLFVIPFYLVLHITSLLARSMAVVSAVTAAAVIHVIFWSKSPTLMSWAVRRFEIRDALRTTDIKDVK